MDNFCSNAGTVLYYGFLVRNILNFDWHCVVCISVMIGGMCSSWLPVSKWSVCTIGLLIISILIDLLFYQGIVGPRTGSIKRTTSSKELVDLKDQWFWLDDVTLLFIGQWTNLSSQAIWLVELWINILIQMIWLIRLWSSML